MALLPWKPFYDLDKFFEEEDFFLPVFSSKKINEPLIDIYETDKDIVAEMNIAGFKPENIDISVENGVLTVKGNIEEEKEDKNKNYWRKEIKKSSFEKMIRLPKEVDEDKTEANYENGILKITLPKIEQKKKTGKKIKIKTK